MPKLYQENGMDEVRSSSPFSYFVQYVIESYCKMTLFWFTTHKSCCIKLKFIWLNWSSIHFKYILTKYQKKATARNLHLLRYCILLTWKKNIYGKPKLWPKFCHSLRLVEMVYWNWMDLTHLSIILLKFQRNNMNRIDRILCWHL